MKRHLSNEDGSLLLPFIIVLIFFLTAVGFGAWAFMSRQDYKNNSDDKAAVAAQRAVVAEDAKKDAAFAESEKSPLETYNGPATFGSLTFQYPKTWNEYDLISTSSRPIDNYFSSGAVPDISSGQQYSLRVQLTNTPYLNVMESFDKPAAEGTSVVSAYRLPKVPSVLGSIVVGPVGNAASGTMVLLPIRDKTLVIWTESSNTSDFVNIVLPSLSFSP